MRLLRLVLALGIAISLLTGSAVGLSAQEESPEATPSPSPASATVEPESEPLPVADYWGEWAVHKQASRQRVNRAVENATRARAKSKSYYRALVGVHSDELLWLAGHQPEDCYRDEYERWQAATAELRSIAKRTVRQGMKRTQKQRRAALKRLDKVVNNFADCPESLPVTPDAPDSNPFVGSWRSLDDFVEPGGFRDRNRTSLTIADDGTFVNRDPKNVICRRVGLGYVPLTWRGTGEFIADDNPVFAATGRVHCYPKGGRDLVTESGTGEFRHDAAADVLIRDDVALCYWRDKAGSPKDCRAYWRGTPAPVEDAEASLVESANADEKTTASPETNG